MDMLPVVDNFEAMVYKCSNFFRSKGSALSRYALLAVKEVLENKLYQFKKMKSILKFYTFKSKCSVQMTIYYALSKLIIWEEFLKVFPYLIPICQKIVQVFSILKQNYENYQEMEIIYFKGIIATNMLIDQIICYVPGNILF